VCLTNQFLTQRPCRFGATCNHKQTCSFAHPKVVGTVQKPVDVMAMLCVDTSGSMAGGSIQAATAGLHTLVRALKARDVLGLYKFDTSVDCLQKFDRNHKIDWAKHVATLLAAPRGGTALYDAAMHSLDALQTYAKPKHDARQLRVVVVLTDGADNRSQQHTLDSLIQRVHNCTIANFHFMLLGVGVDKRTYDALFVPGKPNLHFIDVHDASSQAILDAFGTVQKKIYALQQKLIVRTTTTTTTTATTTTIAASTAPTPTLTLRLTPAAPAVSHNNSTSTRPRIQVLRR
jgi:uncharacterized protein YegL